jgi:hypothetical protein
MIQIIFEMGLGYLLKILESYKPDLYRLNSQAIAFEN